MWIRFYSSFACSKNDRRRSILAYSFYDHFSLTMTKRNPIILRNIHDNSSLLSSACENGSVFNCVSTPACPGSKACSLPGSLQLRHFLEGVPGCPWCLGVAGGCSCLIWLNAHPGLSCLSEHVISLPFCTISTEKVIPCILGARREHAVA